MLKQQVSRIKKVLTILLAVLFVVSVAGAVSNANLYTNTTLHVENMSFDAPDGRHIDYIYIGDFVKNYDEYIKSTSVPAYDPMLNKTVNETVEEWFKVIQGKGTHAVKINGTLLDKDDPKGEIAQSAYSVIARYKEQIDEAKMDADLNNTYENDLKIQDEVLRIDPQNETAWINKGLALYNLTKYDEALTAYDKAIGINPRNSKTWTNKGLALDRLKKYDEAIKAYDKAIGINSQAEIAWIKKGEALEK